MRLSAIITFFLGSILFLHGAERFENRGVDVRITQKKGQTTHYLVRRQRPDICRKLAPNNANLWSGAYAGEKVPAACKGTYVQTTGSLQPIVMDDEIETYGELEVLAFLSEMQSDPDKVLIDTRKEEMFRYLTIPGAVNMPFYYFKEHMHYPDELEYAFNYLGGVKDKEGHYHFEKPKTILIFCNGPWCSLSTRFAEGIVDAGFPAEHIKWYRGGMQSWLIGGFTSTRPKTLSEAK